MITKLNLEDILFLDIETVPETQHFSDLDRTKQDLWEHKSQYQRKEDITAEEFYERAGIWAEFGKIVCISVGYFNIQGDIRTFRVTSFHGEEIKILKDNLANTNATLSTVKEEKNNMSLFGMQMSKAGYSALMWSFIAILLALLLLFIYKFRNSNIITKQAKKSLEDTEREFDEHRSIALEREQKVRRQLQDEINKQKTNKKDK